jgi:hypothetical protein
MIAMMDGVMPRPLLPSIQAVEERALFGADGGHGALAGERGRGRLEFPAAVFRHRCDIPIWRSRPLRRPPTADPSRQASPDVHSA